MEFPREGKWGYSGVEGCQSGYSGVREVHWGENGQNKHENALCRELMGGP